MQAIVLVFENGHFKKIASLPEAMPKEIKWHTHDGFSLHVPQDFNLSYPIHCLFIGDNHYRQQNVIVLEENSTATYIEEYQGRGLASYATEITSAVNLHKGAQLNYYKIQNESVKANHCANIQVYQQKDSSLYFFATDQGAQCAKHHINIQLKEAHTACYLHGLYWLQQNAQLVENHLQIDHLAPHSESLMFYKGILDNKTKSFFRGKVKVHALAHSINTNQANHNLLLSADAEVKTQPELEIYADDIKCKHGATVGQLDAAALFYLRARGLTALQAQALLTAGFGKEVLNKIADAAIKAYLYQKVGYEEY